jgi:cell division protein FtsX
MLGPHLTGALRPLEDFVSDPALTVACVLLIVVSVAWVVVARMIWLNLKRAARKAQRPARRLSGR